MLERDEAGPPAGPADEAWDGWRRAGVSQFRLPHYMLPRWWAEVRESLPELGVALDEAGAGRFNPLTGLPSSLRGAIRDDDQRFETVTARRPVLEAVLAKTAAAAGVTVLRGVRVTGLVSDGRSPAPRVTGVTTDRGTFNYLQTQNRAQNLRIVVRDNSASARGGANFLTNSFHAYVINKDRFAGNGNVRIKGRILTTIRVQAVQWLDLWLA